MMWFKKRKSSLICLGFWQALGLVVYCSLIGLFFWRAEKWFGKITAPLGPILLLLLLVVSALICGFIALTQPFLLWQKKETQNALKLIAYTVAWLSFFTLLLILFLAIFFLS